MASGAWALPAGPAFQPVLDRAGELCRKGGGSFAVIDAAPRDAEAAAMITDVFAAARIDEWTEFVSDCEKFEQEIEREISKKKFTFGELEEEEQSLERLRRWYRDLKKRDVLLLPEAIRAENRLLHCASILDDYATQVYDVMLGATATSDTPFPSDDVSGVQGGGHEL